MSKGEKIIFEILYEDFGLLKEFINVMTGRQVGNFMVLVQNFDFLKYNNFLDVGGFAGMLFLMVVKYNFYM